MKVKLGPYTNWIGPYQIAEKLLWWLDRYEDNRVHKLGKWLSQDRHGKDSYLLRFCQWVNSFKKRQEYVRIDRYDAWNADHTMAVIIAPLLKQLRATKHGSGYIDDADVPEHLRSTAAPKPENDWDSDANLHKRYEWFLDELIWAFEQHAKDDEESKFYDHSESNKEPDLMKSITLLKVDTEGLKAHQQRKQHAFTMFGKYFQTLWD
jgi:hypothetical protein